MNIASVVEGHDPASPALIADDTVITYGELVARVDQVRAGLTRRGVIADSRVLVVGENEIDFVVAVLAVAGLGAHVAPIRAVNPLPEVERKIAAVDPTAIVLCPTAEWLQETVASSHSVVCPMSEFTSEDANAAPPIAERAATDTAFLLLTSGVTSQPKVAVLSHGNLDWVQQASTTGVDAVKADDVALGVLPLTHIFGLNVVLFSTLRAGGSIVLEQRFDPARSLELIERHGVTTISGAPAMWQQWLALDASDLSDNPFASLRRASSGAAALPIETFNGIRERFGVEIGEGYGLTETSPILTWSRGVTPRARSVGKPVAGVEIVIVEPDGTAVDPGDVGEIVARSPGVFQGYLNAPDATNEVLTEDGWFWTGDMGVFDADGFLYLVDRIKDIVIVSGFNVYPAEVESILMDHPAVRGAIVVGASDERTGERVVAHVSGRVDVDALDQWCRERLSRYKCPSEFHLVDEIPMSANGKPLRRALR